MRIRQEGLPKYTLGFEAISWMMSNLVHGPGDLAGQPYTLHEEQQIFLLWAYEQTGDPKKGEIGRRLVDEAFLSRGKGFASLKPNS